MISHIRLDRSLLEQSKEMDYSKFRQQLKESIRRKMKRESASADACARDDGYGSFFGSSEIVASERVVQEISILLKTQNSSSKFGALGKPGDSVREINLMLKTQNSSSKSVDSVRETKPPQIVPCLNTKVQTLKRTRDYSFLFSDDDTSAAQFPSEKRCSSVSCGGGRGETAAVTVPGRVQSSVERQENKTKVISKNPVSSPKPRIKPPKQNPTLPAMQEHRRTKKPPRKHSDEDGEDWHRAITMIRKMFGYNPNKYSKFDDDDERDMETSFRDIQKEEKRSERIGKKEDAEELLRIQKEERKERLKRESKKSKLSKQ